MDVEDYPEAFLEGPVNDGFDAVEPGCIDLVCGVLVGGRM